MSQVKKWCKESKTERKRERKEDNSVVAKKFLSLFVALPAALNHHKKTQPGLMKSKTNWKWGGVSLWVLKRDRSKGEAGFFLSPLCYYSAALTSWSKTPNPKHRQNQGKISQSPSSKRGPLKSVLETKTVSSPTALAAGDTEEPQSPAAAMCSRQGAQHRHHLHRVWHLASQRH